MPTWILVLQGLLTPAIAVVITVIAFLQWQLAKRKLALDLFDKRMQVYFSLVDASRRVLNARPHPTSEMLFDFSRAKHDARFLFGDEIINYLRDVEKELIDVVANESELDETRSEPDRSEIIRKNRKSKEAVSAFIVEFPKRLEPYMRMDERLYKKK